MDRSILSPRYAQAAPLGLGPGPQPQTGRLRGPRRSPYPLRRICPIETPEGPNIGLITSLRATRGSTTSAHRVPLPQGWSRASSPATWTISAPTRSPAKWWRRPTRLSEKSASRPTCQLSLPRRLPAGRARPGRLRWTSRRCRWSRYPPRSYPSWSMTTQTAP